LIGHLRVPWGSIGDTIIDDQYALVEDSRDYTGCVGFCPLAGVPQTPFGLAQFYVHCLSFELDVPVLFVRTRDWAPPTAEPIFRKRRIRWDDDFDHVREALLYLTDTRLGDLQFLTFRRPSTESVFHLAFTKMYAGSADLVGLYSTALRQLDPLSEFLHYYRVIESVDGKNGKAWVRANLPRLGAFRFGTLWGSVDPASDLAPLRRNVFALLKRRALSRLKGLASIGMPLDKYLYNIQRCGIAHGKSGLKTYDFGEGIRAATKDVYLVKMLARMAIEDRVPANSRPRR
jgi:hypothetical protein